MSMSRIDFRVRPLDAAADIELESEGEGYGRVYGDGFAHDRSLETLITDLETYDVLAVMQAEREDDDPVQVNERVADALLAHPRRLVAGIATTDPRRPDSLEILKHAHDQLGLKGWNFPPGFLKVAVMDPRCTQLFEYCQANGHPVTVHTGINFSTTGSIEFGRPVAVCDLACTYPELTIVANHGGWPWVAETLAVLWKHPNVYADFGAVAPKRMVGPAGGWEPVAHWMNSMVSNQILFASDWPMMRHDRLSRELDLLGLSPEAHDKYTRLNAANLLDRFWDIRLG